MKSNVKCSQCEKHVLAQSQLFAQNVLILMKTRVCPLYRQTVLILLKLNRLDQSFNWLIFLWL